MLSGQEGFVPEPFFLTESLKKEPRFHDPDKNSLFSNSSSVQNFRQWSSTKTASGRTTPTQPSQEDLPETATLLVRSSRPIAQPPAHWNVGAHFSWKRSEECYEAHIPSLITPKSSINGANAKQVRYAILEWQPLLDSSNMEFLGMIGLENMFSLAHPFASPRLDQDSD